MNKLGPYNSGWEVVTCVDFSWPIMGEGINTHTARELLGEHMYFTLIVTVQLLRGKCTHSLQYSVDVTQLIRDFENMLPRHTNREQQTKQVIN